MVNGMNSADSCFGEKSLFDINVSWIVEKAEENDIRDSVFVCKKGESDDLTNFLNLQSCIRLRKPDNVDDLEIEISLKDNCKVINDVTLLSEANLVEIYGMFGEYLKTVRGICIEEVDDISVFSCNIQNLHLPAVLLKLVGLRGETNIWIFGIQFSIDEKEKENGKINFNRVERMLADVKLSEGAERFKKCVQECSSNDLLQKFNAGPSHCQSVGQLQPEVLPAMTEHLKKYVDASVSILENKISASLNKQIEGIEDRMNKRLDSLQILLEKNLALSA